MFFHSSTVIINSFLKNKLPASARALLKPCQADAWLDQDGRVTPQLILATDKREELPQLEKAFHSCHCPAAGANPVRGSEGKHSGASGMCCSHAVPCSPATRTAGALCISTCCCWGQRFAGLRYCIWLVQAECVYWCQMTLQPSRKPCHNAVQSCSSHTLPGPQERVFVRAWCGWLGVTRVSRCQTTVYDLQGGQARPCSLCFSTTASAGSQSHHPMLREQY